MNAPVPRRYGLAVPIEQVALDAQGPWLAEAAALGFTDVCSAERGGIDGLAPLYLASVTAPSLRLNTSVLPVFTRGPALLAQSALSLCLAAPGRVTIGLGASSDVVVEDWNGIPFDRPYQRIVDTLRFLRSALAGDKVTERYDTFEVHGFRAEVQIEQPPPLLLAALRPRMLRLAGAQADGVVLGSIGPADLPQILAEVATPGEVHVRIFVLPASSRDEIRGVATRILGSYLSVQVYRRFHEWLGRGELLRPVWQRWDAGARKEAMAEIPDELIDQLIVWGNPEQLRQGVERFAHAGATMTIPMVIASDTDAIRAGIRALAPNPTGPA